MNTSMFSTFPLIKFSVVIIFALISSSVLLLLTACSSINGT
jgi:hypothetical protein